MHFQVSTKILNACTKKVWKPIEGTSYIPYPLRAAVRRFKLVALLLLGHVRESIREHHLGARPHFSSSVLYVWFVKLSLIVFVMGGRWPYSCCFVACCLQDLFKIAHRILV